MPIVGIFGPQRAGKTLLSVLLARFVQAIGTYYEQTVPIYTNILGYGENYHRITDIGELPFNREHAKVVILDESMFSLDSRNSNSKANIAWSQAFAYFGKSNVALAIFVTHRPSMLDVRIRDQLQYAIMCRKSKKQFEYLLYDTMMMTSRAFNILKVDQVFNFANYDTHDQPPPIRTEKLQTMDIFNLQKK